MTFARLFSLSFSSKSLWYSPVPLKFESYNLHHCKKNFRKLVFLVFTEQLPDQIIVGLLHCYEVTLVKKCNKPLLQKSETNIFNQIFSPLVILFIIKLYARNNTFQKRFIKILLKVSGKNNSGVSKINQIMSKFLTLSKRL